MGEDDYIDDLVVLGRTGPEALSDDERTTVCLGGYSEKHGYVRLFPTRMNMDTLSRWNVVEVPVTDPEDPRDSSWQIQGSKAEWDELPEKVEKVGELEKDEQIRLIDSLANDCTRQLNERKESVGIAKVDEVHNLYFEPGSEVAPQTTLDGRERLTKDKYPNLRVEYTCSNCDLVGTHDQQIFQWGWYRLWESYDDDETRKEKVKKATKLEDDDYQNYFLIGNMRHQPTAFIIGSNIFFKKEDMIDAGVRPDGQPGLGDF